MGDRTNITDARQHDAEQAAGVIEQAMRIVDHIDKAARLMGEIITEALDAAGFDVVLRADPDTSDDLFTEARRLLDAYPEDVFPPLPDGWEPADEFDGWVDDETAVSVTPDAFAAHALRKIALPVIAALLAERDADVSAGAVARTVAMSHIAAERDAERAARERAEAEARQLREAIREHKDRHNSWRQQTQRPSDIALWAALNAAAVAEGAEDRGQTDG